MKKARFNDTIGGKLLPDEAKYWPCSMRHVYRVVRDHFPKTRWLGTTVRRPAKDDPSVWSTHSWPGQATDFAPKDAETGDAIVKMLRKRFPKSLNIVWEAKLHRPHHFHVEKKPSKSRHLTPPMPTTYKEKKCRKPKK